MPHNITVLLYHLTLPAKYRRAALDAQVDEVLKEACLGIGKCYQVKFLEIGTDKDHVHFLVQSVPNYSVTKIVSSRCSGNTPPLAAGTLYLFRDR